MFKNVSNSELISKTKQLACEERVLLKRVLEHLEEIERRKLHLVKHSSMFIFCQNELGYSGNEAHTRICAMRLSREVPDVLPAVEEGRLSLTNLAQAQAFFKQAATPFLVEEKKKVLKDLEGLSTRECEKKLFPHALQKKTFEVDDELLADLKRIRELWGNQDFSEKEVLRKMAKLVLSRIDPELKGEARSEAKTGAKRSVGAPKVIVAASGKEDREEVEAECPPSEFVTPENRHIPAAVQRAVWKRDQGRCTYGFSSQRCDSRYALQFDHLNEYAYGGAHTVDNLRLLCRAHHRVKSAGERVERIANACIARFGEVSTCVAKGA